MNLKHISELVPTRVVTDKADDYTKHLTLGSLMKSSYISNSNNYARVKNYSIVLNRYLRGIPNGASLASVLDVSNYSGMEVALRVYCTGSLEDVAKVVVDTYQVKDIYYKEVPGYGLTERVNMYFIKENLQVTLMFIFKRSMDVCNHHLTRMGQLVSSTFSSSELWDADWVNESPLYPIQKRLVTQAGIIVEPNERTIIMKVGGTPRKIPLSLDDLRLTLFGDIFNMSLQSTERHGGSCHPENFLVSISECLSKLWTASFTGITCFNPDVLQDLTLEELNPRLQSDCQKLVFPVILPILKLPFDEIERLQGEFSLSIARSNHSAQNPTWLKHLGNRFKYKSIEIANAEIKRRATVVKDSRIPSELFTLADETKYDRDELWFNFVNSTKGALETFDSFVLTRTGPEVASLFSPYAEQVREKFRQEQAAQLAYAQMKEQAEKDAVIGAFASQVKSLAKSKEEDVGYDLGYDHVEGLLAGYFTDDGDDIPF